MKKLLSVLLCITMLMSGMSVFADTLDEFYGILEKNSFSDFSCNVKASMTLDAPIELLKLANDALADEEVYIDLTKVVGSVFETTLDMDMKLNSSSDFKKFDSEIDIKTNLPLVINDNFKITVDMQMDTYMSYDLTDEENPTFKFIFSVPIFDRYLVIDSNDLVGNEEIGDFYAKTAKNC